MLAIVAAVFFATERPYTFSYVAERDLKSVTVAGTFNNWDKRAMPMERQSDGKTWKRIVPLAPGKHLYKFVLDDEQWITDPDSKRSEDDGNGNVNTVLMLLPDDYDRPARRGDGLLTLSALRHATEVPYLNWDRGRLMLTLRIRPDDADEIAAVVGGRRLPMKEVSRDDLYAVLRTEVPWNLRTDLEYAFWIRDGGAQFHYGPEGLRSPRAQGNRFKLKASEYQPFEVPGWVEQSVLYQIFPDRFENGDRSNDPKNVVAWDAAPTWYNRYGGDAAGVRKRMGHLTDLGIGAVYFNPVFYSPSNHRYEANDFLQIDPEIGTNEEFAALTRDLKARGIRTILDGVFNHTSPDFRQFKDIREKGRDSRYVDWFFIKSFPVVVGENPNYEAWWGFPSMPKVNLMNPEARSYMLGVVDFWQKNAEIAGWRLDVANEVPMDFWRAFRSHVKGIDPKLWIVGEVWGDGSPWLKGDQWDSVMNYQFRDAVLRFIAEGRTKPSEFIQRLMQVHESYAPQVSRNMMNLLSSHDTPRFLTLCNGDRRLAMLGATVQMTWVGAPSIYYGEELGMEGGGDPECRKGMEWHRATPDNDLLNHYRRLIKLRNSSHALQSGHPVPLLVDDENGTLAFARVFDGEVVIVALNRSNRVRTLTLQLPSNLKSDQGFTCALDGRSASVAREGSLRLSLAPLGSAVLIREGSDSKRSAGAFGRPAMTGNVAQPISGE
jgi:cyclomaltodextrinase / maltogenic alpha-amylase / neopullulanase